MEERRFLVSSPQLFCLVFFHLLSGMLLFCGGSFYAALFASLFCVCLCVVGASLCLGHGGAAAFCGRVFGRAGAPLRMAAAFFVSLSLLRTLLAFAGGFSRYYDGAGTALFVPALLLLCVFAVRRGFYRAARFAELCVFALAAALLLALLGGAGEGLFFSADESILFGGFEAVGASPAFFSLYLRSAGEDGDKMSVYAKNSAFRPSPLACGVCACAAALAAYAFFRLAAGENIVLSLLLGFASLSRLFLGALSLCDLAAIPEEAGGQKSTAQAALLFAAAVLLGDFAKTAAVFANVLFPCVVFAASVLGHGKGTGLAEKK